MFSIINCIGDLKINSEWDTFEQQIIYFKFSIADRRAKVRARLKLIWLNQTKLKVDENITH